MWTPEECTADKNLQPALGNGPGGVEKQGHTVKAQDNNKYHTRILGLVFGISLLMMAAAIFATPASAANSLLLHNSISTNSDKWSEQGGWGIEGGKYGKFTCNTCHKSRSGNIKRVKKILTVTDVNSSDQFPIEVDSTPPESGITFFDNREGTADFGADENRIDPTQSDKI